MDSNDMKLIKQLLEAGVHFGHQTNRWNPKMEKFIFGEKSGIYIIDLEKTAEYLKKACEFVKEVARAGSYILFVGTKKQAQKTVKESAEKCDMFFVTERWLGGTLTNFATIRKSINKLEKLENTKTDGIYDSVSKKERAQIDKQIVKLNKTLSGIRKMDRLPGAVYVVDSKMEEIAVKEAKKLGIPIVALVDTNCNPDVINYIIPGNDDALRSINLVTELLTESIVAGRKQYLSGSKTKKKKEVEAPVKKTIDEKEGEESIKGDIRLKDAEKGKEKEKQDEQARNKVK